MMMLVTRQVVCRSGKVMNGCNYKSHISSSAKLHNRIQRILVHLWRVPELYNMCAQIEKSMNLLCPN